MLQPDFFELLTQDPLEQENAPDLDLRLDMIQILNQLGRDSVYNRDRIVDRINLCLVNSNAKPITIAQMNKWIAPSQAHTFPAWLLPAFCWAVQSMAPINVLVRPFKHQVTDARDSVMNEILMKELSAAQQQREVNKLKKAASNELFGSGK